MVLDDSYPQNATDNATIDDGGNLCTYDPESFLTINKLTLAGDSPTKRKLHIRDEILFVEEMALQDYAELDADKSVIVNELLTLSGDVWIDLADGVTLFALGGSGADEQGVHITGTQTRLNLTTGATADLTTTGILIDADGANAQRSFKLDGGTVSVSGPKRIWLKSDTDADNKRAKLWLANGSIVMGAGADLVLEGGNSPAKRAELDLDQDFSLTFPGPSDSETIIKGYVSIDIAAGKTFIIDL